MKRKTILSAILTFFVLLVSTSTTVFAQDTVYVNGKPKIVSPLTSYDESASPLKKDDYLLEVSYGYPFVPIREANYFGVNFFNQTKSKKIIRNTNHICLRADYQLNSEFSVGLEMTYAAQEFQYYRSYTGVSQGGVVTTTPDSMFTARISKLRFLAKIAYHFNLSDRFDAYTTAGFGFKQANYYTADSYMNSMDFINEVSPVAIRASVGGRFFINENLAVHVEGGIGGPMMQIGLSYKLHSYFTQSESLSKPIK